MSFDRLYHDWLHDVTHPHDMVELSHFPSPEVPTGHWHMYPPKASSTHSETELHADGQLVFGTQEAPSLLKLSSQIQLPFTAHLYPIDPQLYCTCFTLNPKILKLGRSVNDSILDRESAELTQSNVKVSLYDPLGRSPEIK
jgi:hypothetical protein